MPQMHSSATVSIRNHGGAFFFCPLPLSDFFHNRTLALSRGQGWLALMNAHLFVFGLATPHCGTHRDHETRMINNLFRLFAKTNLIHT